MKKYFQVVYNLTSCLRYTSRIPSQEPIKFYQLLLRRVRVEPGQKDKAYAVLLNKDKSKKHEDPEVLPIECCPAPKPLTYDDDEGMMRPGEPPPEPKAKARTAAKTSRHPKKEPRGDIAEPLLLPPAPPTPPVVLPREGDPTRPPGIVEPPPSGPVAGLEDDDTYLPPPPAPHPVPPAKRTKRPKLPRHPGLDGAEVSYDPYINPVTRVAYPNWIIYCPNADHGDCHKSRGTTDAMTRRYGVIEPLAYLHAWLSCKAKDEDHTHRSVHPTQAQTAAYAETHRDELKAIVDGIAS